MAVLLDTSFFVAYINSRDRNHQRSRELASDIFSGKYGQVVITEHIFDETITTCMHRVNNVPEVERLGDYILDSEIELFQVNEELFRETWDMFKKYHYSFTDCTSAAFSNKYGVKYIVTFDHHFDTFKWLIRIC